LSFIRDELAERGNFVRTVHIDTPLGRRAKNIRVKEVPGYPDWLMFLFIDITTSIDHDWMTDEYTRTGFMDRARLFISEFSEKGQFSLVYTNVNGFKAVNELFGDKNLDTNVKNAATRVISEQFSPFELSRVNAATLLMVDRNYKGFLAKEKTELTDESVGTYLTAYQHVIDKVNAMNSKTYSPHLDKHWHLPAYMPNIGSTQADEIERVFRALCWGLLLGKFKSEARGGDNYWKYVGDYATFIKDVDGHLILTGNSLKYAVDRLFQGLTTNPGIVAQVLQAADEWWNDAKDQWLQKEYDETVVQEKMKQFAKVQEIVNFRFNMFPGDKSNNGWFSILTSKQSLLLDKLLNMDGEQLRVDFFDELLSRLIALFGPSKNTEQVCEYVIKRVDKANADLAKARLNEFEKRNSFQPIV
jgi:hypothetical protein